MRPVLIALAAAALLQAQETRAFRLTERDQVVTFTDGIRPVRDLHVDRTGDDADGDGSATRPFRTLGRAAKSATPGTAIKLGAGSIRPARSSRDSGAAPTRPSGSGARPSAISP